MQKYNFEQLIKLAQAANYLGSDSTRDAVLDQIVDLLRTKKEHEGFFEQIQKDYIVQMLLKDKIIALVIGTFLKENITIGFHKKEPTVSLGLFPFSHGYAVSSASIFIYNYNYHTYDNPTRILFSLNQQITDFTEAPNGKTIAFIDHGKLEVRNAQTGEFLFNFFSDKQPTPCNEWSLQYCSFITHLVKSPCRSFAYSNNGNSISALFENEVYQWDLNTGKLQNKVILNKDTNKYQQTIKWSSDGEKICFIRSIVDRNRQLKYKACYYDIKSNAKKTTTIEGCSGFCQFNQQTLINSPDNKYLLFSNDIDTIKIQNLTENNVQTITISPAQSIQKINHILKMLSNTDGTTIFILYLGYNSNSSFEYIFRTYLMKNIKIGIASFDLKSGACIQNVDITEKCLLDEDEEPQKISPIESISYSSYNKKIIVKQSSGLLLFDAETLNHNNTIKHLGQTACKLDGAIVIGNLVHPTEQKSVLALEFIYDQETLEEALNQLTLEQIIFLHTLATDCKTSLTTQEYSMYKTLPKMLKQRIKNFIIKPKK